MNAHRRRLVPALALLLAACSSTDGDPAAPTGELRGETTLFFTETRPATAVMDALYVGVVERDAQGCLRLGGGDGKVTVIWPHRFELVARSGALFVRAPGGREIGRIGGSFRFGGGEIAALHEGVALSAAQRTQAAARCPGRYWIVGDVL